MKKKIAIALAFVCIAPLASCYWETVVLDESKTYEITSEIHSLDIRINAADFKIKQGDAFSVESNLKNLSVFEENGVLKIIEEIENVHNGNYNDAVLTLYVPNNTVFQEIDIDTGAAKMTVDSLSTSSLDLTLGAGDVRFEYLNVSSEMEVEGGAGAITIADGIINNLDLEMGVGELNFTATLLGYNDLDFGVGESNLTILGDKDDYKVELEKGLGAIFIDGQKVSDFGSSGNGQNYLKIDGGVGTINLTFLG